MYTYTTDRGEKNKSQAAANSLPGQLKHSWSDAEMQAEQTAVNMTEPAIRNSPQTRQLQVCQAMGNAGGSLKQFPAVPFIQRAEEQNKTGLPGNLKSGVENLSGISLDDVKVHYNSDKPARIQAHAYAQGSDIHIANGQEKHLPHEAWHVVQQKQGRVQPTVQAKDNLPINDDEGLEKEADEMGEKALQMKATDFRKLKTSTTASTTAQAIMAEQDFITSTPWKLFKPRKTVVLIDAALRQYIAGRTTANAFNLIQVINNYLAGNHDADRKTAARNLLAQAEGEHDLLVEIGDPNAALIDPLFALVDYSRRVQLKDLAHDFTAPHAASLIPVITEIGQENIVGLRHSNLITAMGLAHLPLLPGMIRDSGGAGQFVNLTNVINYRHAGNGNLARDLTAEAAGDAVIFARLCGEVPFFLETGPPGGVPAGAAAASVAYNAAVDTHNNNVVRPGFVNNLNTLITDATTARDEAVNLGGIAAGIIAGINNRIAPVAAEVARINGLPPAAAVNYQIGQNAALQLKNILFQLNNQVNARVGVLAATVPPTIPAIFNQAAYTASYTNVINNQLTIAATQQVPTIAGINFDHFLTRHTSHYFDFAHINVDNTQWNVSWGAAASVNLEAQFVAVLANLQAANNFLLPNRAIPNQVAPAGSAQIAARPGAAPNQIIVGQFFPEAGGANFDHPDTTMNAIHQLL